jgi:hypothetical protein
MPGTMVIRCLALLLAVVLSGCQSQPGPTLPPPTGEAEPPSPAILNSVEYEVRETLTLVNAGEGQPSSNSIWPGLTGLRAKPVACSNDFNRFQAKGD